MTSTGKPTAAAAAGLAPSLPTKIKTLEKNAEKMFYLWNGSLFFQTA